MNRHPSIHTRNDQLSLDDLRAYQADQLSGPARHRVERLMLENPFYADALDGLEALQQVGGSLKSQTRDLHLALQERVQESATPRRLMPLWVTSLAASVLLVLAASVYLIVNTAKLQRARVEAVPHQPIEPGTVLIDPKDLGTPEVVATTPKASSVVAKSSPGKLSVRSGKVARKGHRRSEGRRVAALVPNVPALFTTDTCSFCVMNDEQPLLPRLDMDVPGRHSINTERAFLN
ncbi:hypothetical protein [Fibrivirga algicola]|uniref:Zinc-finger domain-containing protein n=1 Tax=Fibrivirga algicola TaxID=2950420 RepID=A0ABX0QFL1_9BACT|nr:hypothetical protein [Fibrivirga algicola]NID08849.1 hypothetical protein [Fibrivirga algicola]